MTNSFNFLPPLHVLDRTAKKPSDWVDNEMIPIGGGKPEGHDDIPRRIPSPTATQPELWDEYEDGEWLPPLVPNPAWSGDWEQAFVKNPKYIGKWERPYVANPLFHGKVAEDRVRDLHYVCNPCTHVGIEIYQMNHGTVFDDILVTDSVEEAELGRAMFLRKSKEEMWTQYKKAKEDLLQGHIDQNDFGDIDRVDDDQTTRDVDHIENVENVKDDENGKDDENVETADNTEQFAGDNGEQILNDGDQTMASQKRDSIEDVKEIEVLENEAVREAQMDQTTLPGFRQAEDTETRRIRNEERRTAKNRGDHGEL